MAVYAYMWQQFSQDSTSTEFSDANLALVMIPLTNSVSEYRQFSL